MKTLVMLLPALVMKRKYDSRIQRTGKPTLRRGNHSTINKHMRSSKCRRLGLSHCSPIFYISKALIGLMLLCALAL